ncbi:MAG: DUF1570 domain-containing protein [Planctomycetes bacterium]|nr:DUF1570 domain-containing protein [Planctomycetota bacterium]
MPALRAALAVLVATGLSAGWLRPCASQDDPPARAGLSVHLETRHFRLHADLPGPSVACAGELEKFFLKAAASLSLPATVTLRPIHVHLFGSRSAFDAVVEASYPEYRGRPAFMVFRHEPAAAADASRWEWSIATWCRDNPAETRRELYHEVTHILLRARAPRPPPWLDEGVAECFETACVSAAGEVLCDEANELDLAAVQDAIQAGRMVPLRALVTATPAEAARWTDLHYAAAWSFVHFLRHGRGGGLRHLFDLFVEAVSTDPAAADGGAAAFAKHLLPLGGAGGATALQGEWLEYLKGLGRR